MLGRQQEKKVANNHYQPAGNYSQTSQSDVNSKWGGDGERTRYFPGDQDTVNRKPMGTRDTASTKHRKKTQ